MKMIEFVGCEGVGKSSFYEALMTNPVHSKKHILSEFEADHIITRKILKRDNSILKYAFINAIKIPIISSFIHHKILRVEYKKELYKYKNQWEECIRILFMNHCNANLTLRSSLYSYSALLTKIEKQALYENDVSDHILILEPGVFHKLNNILMYFADQDIDKVSTEIFSRIPIVPYGLVYFKTSAEMIYGRFCRREGKRDRWIQDFKDFNEDLAIQKIMVEQRIIHTGVGILKKRGAAIVEIDASEDADKQLNIGLNFIEKMRRMASQNHD
jgi:hypothetical protein